MRKLKSFGVLLILVSLLITTGCDNSNVEGPITIVESQSTSINIMDEETEEGINDARIIVQELGVDSYTDEFGQVTIEYTVGNDNMYPIELFAKNYGYYTLEDFQAGSTNYTVYLNEIEVDPEANNFIEVNIVGEETEFSYQDEVELEISLLSLKDLESSYRKRITGLYPTSIYLTGEDEKAIYNREIFFIEGKANIVIDLRVWGMGQTIEVRIPEINEYVYLENFLSVKAGDPKELKLELYRYPAKVTMTDGRNRIIDYEGSKMAHISYRLIQEFTRNVYPLIYIPEVDEEGNVIIDFYEGEGQFDLELYFQNKFKDGEFPPGYYEIIIEVDGFQGSQFVENYGVRK